MAFHRLLVIKPSSLGDVVQALQVVAALKARRTDVAVDWVVRDCFLDLVRASGLVDRIFPFFRESGLRGLLSCCRQIRGAGHFDSVWDMQGLFRSGWMAHRARSDRKIGRRDSREWARLFYTERLSLPRKAVPHAVEILMEFLPTLAVERSTEFLRPHFASPAQPVPSPYLLIAPESRVAAKNWPHFAALTEKLCRRRPSWRVLWVGQRRSGPAPRADNFCDLRGQTSLERLISLVQGALGVIANDSGCGHLAAALGRPVLSLFVATDPLRFAPYPPAGEGHFFARNPPPSFPELEIFLDYLG
ncbi:MAG: glycosyltransferase family 9 protein [Puniceicoccales bacterium]|nr:glycosyltransferase family 9 protein [Puniceicoccales bacterium]